METRTISYHVGSNSNYRIAHNARLYKDNWPDNIDRERSNQNIVLVNETLPNAYHRLFDAAVKEYNAKQTRADRKITDYLKSLQKSGKNPNYVYEAIVQFGDKDNSEQDNAVAKEVLQQYVQDFQRRNPQLAVIGAYIHMDEATPHLHLDWVPVGPNEGPKARGMAVVASMDKALRAQGYTQGKTRKDTPLARWTADERAAFDQLCADRGYNITHPQAGQDVQHLTMLEYKNQQEQQKLEATIEQLQQEEHKLAETINKRQQEEQKRDTYKAQSQQAEQAAKQRKKELAIEVRKAEIQAKQKIDAIDNEVKLHTEAVEKGKTKGIKVQTVKKFGQTTLPTDEKMRIETISQGQAVDLELKDKTIKELKDKNNRQALRIHYYRELDNIARKLGIMDAHHETTVTTEFLNEMVDAFRDTDEYIDSYTQEKDAIEWAETHPQPDPEPTEPEHNYRTRNYDDYER